MSVKPSQFISVTRFHKENLNILLEQYIDLPEAPGILAAMLYLQEYENRALVAYNELKKAKEKDDEWKGDRQ